MIHSVKSVLFYTSLSILLAHCGKAEFDGAISNGHQSQNTQEENSKAPDDSLPKDPIPNSSGEFKVIETMVVDYDFSSTGETIELVIENTGKDLIVFLHFLQPTQVVLKGETDHIKAIFLTANSMAAESHIIKEDLSDFPESKIATGFFPNYTMGNDVETLVGSLRANAWRTGAEVSTYASTLGEKSCFELAFESSKPSTMSLILQNSTPYTCFF